MSDELDEAEAWMRTHGSETPYAVGGETDARELWLIMAELDRLRLVEQAATALVENYGDDNPMPGESGRLLYIALTDVLNGDTT